MHRPRCREPGQIISWFLRRWQRWRALSRKYVNALALKPSTIGRSGRSGGPLRCSWGSSRWSHTLCTPTDGARCTNCAQGGVVREAVSDLLPTLWRWCVRSFVGAGSDFLRVIWRDRHGESPAGVCGAANRRGLLCGVMAKVQLRACLVSSRVRLEGAKSASFTRGTASYEPFLRGIFLSLRSVSIKASDPIGPPHTPEHQIG
jgi:hypothetical protein